MDVAGHSAVLAEALRHPEAAIVETCQRVEAVSLSSCRGCGGDNRAGEDAFRYLVRLAAGLESIVLGESEIVGQVREAARTASPALGALLGRSIAAARAFRREHGFRTDAGNLFDLAVASTGRPPERVLVVGSGPTARCLVRRARGVQVSSLTVVSRRKPDWIDAFNAPWLPLEELAAAEPAQMAMVCLGGDAQPLSRGEVPARVLVDVSTPRRTLGHDGVLTLRELRDHAFANEAAHRAALQAELDRVADRALAALALDGSSPVGRFRQSAELVRREEVDRIARRHPDIPEETLEAITRRLVNRLFHAPSMRMRQLEEREAALVADLFAHEPGRTRRWPD